MKLFKFYKENMKMIHKCWINQIVISLFGLMVTVPVSAFASKNNLGDIPVVCAAALSVAFYLFVIYDAFWELGTKNMNTGVSVITPQTAAKMSITAYLPTIILLVICTVFFAVSSLGSVEWAGNISGVLKAIITFLLRGMYVGFIYVSPAWQYFPILYLSLIPTPLVCSIAFKMGRAGKQIFKEKKK